MVINFGVYGGNYKQRTMAKELVCKKKLCNAMNALTICFGEYIYMVITFAERTSLVERLWYEPLNSKATEESRRWKVGW